MNILGKIIESKKAEVAGKKRDVPVSILERAPLFKKEIVSVIHFLKDPNRTGIIAEFKRKSPSKGIINSRATVKDVAEAYAANGASAVSILTDENFFGGSLSDLENVSDIKVPRLRKDFIIDEYQVIESKAFGADIILLIAACLTPVEVKILSAIAKNLGLHVLLEIHNEDELGHITENIDVVGVNNRDLKNFTVDINRSIELAEKIPAGKIKISESGINDAASILLLKNAGFNGFLIGEKFMKTSDPGNAFKEFVKALRPKIQLDEN
jgi:indole-3-glycerol phosphate synthase